MDNRFFIFRVNYDDAHDWIMKQILENSILRQGWGPIGLELINRKGEYVNSEVWVKNYLRLWNDSEQKVSGRFDILSRMLEIKEGDLVVIPKSLNNYTLTICSVVGEYSFDFDSHTFWDDFRHTIKISNPRSYKYDSSIESKMISAKFKAYQSPVNNVRNPETQNKILELYRGESSSESKTITQITEEIVGKALRRIADQLLELNPTDFENIIAECLTARGYEILGMRHYDKNGADVDIIASYSLPFFSDATDHFPTLLIQVKKKRGTDWNDEEGVNQLIKSTTDYPHSIKILVNTTDKISDAASRKAKENDIHIISGLKIFDLILKTELKNA
ncbi:MAG: restriction endonuclease [Nitrosopumilus sp.]